MIPVVTVLYVADCGLPCRWRHLLPPALHACSVVSRHSIPTSCTVTPKLGLRLLTLGSRGSGQPGSPAPRQRHDERCTRSGQAAQRTSCEPRDLARNVLRPRWSRQHDTNCSAPGNPRREPPPPRGDEHVQHLHNEKPAPQGPCGRGTPRSPVPPWPARLVAEDIGLVP